MLTASSTIPDNAHSQRLFMFVDAIPAVKINYRGMSDIVVDPV